MTNSYRALSPQAVAMFAEGVFDADFEAAEEKDHLDSGLLELVPRKYKVLSNNFSGGLMGGEYRAGLLKDIEAALIQGGHLQRDDAPAAKKAAKSS